MARALSHGFPWTPADEEKLRELYAMTKSERLAEIFGCSKKAVNSRARVLGLQKAIGHGGKVAWTRKMDQQLRKFYPETPTRDLAVSLGVSKLAAHQRAQKLGIRKAAAFMAKVLRECGVQATQSGSATRFPKNHVPANKGLCRPPGWSIGRGRMRETQFKKGHVSINTMPMWSFRLVDGYLMLKTGKRHSAPNDRWEYVHRLIWEQANGPLPDWREARLWWKDGDHGNCSLSNLELVSAKDHMARTTVHTLPAPLPQLIQLAGALKRKIRTRERKLNGQEHVAGSAEPSVRDAGVAV
jgi:hypothetical protein